MHDLLGYGLALEGLGVAAETLTWGKRVVEAELYLQRSQFELLKNRTSSMMERHSGQFNQKDDP